MTWYSKQTGLAKWPEGPSDGITNAPRYVAVYVGSEDYTWALMLVQQVPPLAIPPPQLIARPLFVGGGFFFFL